MVIQLKEDKYMYLNENYNPYSESAESETPVQNGAKVKNRKHIKRTF